MAKGPDWNDIHRAIPGAIRDAMVEPDIRFHDAPQRNGLDADYVPPGQTAPNPIKVLSYFEMVNLPSTDWLIEGLVPRRSKSVAFGQSDTFKSFLAADMACSVSTGHTWHGKPVKRCKAIYVANEGAIGVGRKRIPAWMAYHDVPPEDRQNIFLVKVETILPNPVSLANLIAAIRTIVEPGEGFFLIVDVLRGTMSGSESDDEEPEYYIAFQLSRTDHGEPLLSAFSNNLTVKLIYS
jgi:AAA domain